MPLYEYQCESCGNRFEVIQRFSDPVIEVCQVCGGPVKKLLSAPAIQFKGSGWYITDYGRGNGSSGNGSRKPASKEGESQASSSGSGAGKETDSKPASGSKQPSTTSSSSGTSGS